MNEPDFPRGWTIRSSTSRFFPVHSDLELIPKPGGFELAVTWEKQDNAKLKLLDLDHDGSGTLKGAFGHPKEKPPHDQERFQLVVTVTRFADERQRLIGALLQLSGREPGSTGVWVAEVQQGTGSPPGE